MALKDALKEKAESPNDWARRKIKAAGYFVKSVERIFPPLEHFGNECEVWFWGRKSGDTTARCERLTAYIGEKIDCEAIIGEGW